MNKQKNILKLLAFTLLLFPFLVKGQDLHFSQYNNAPLFVNPANTGFSNFYDYRVGINNRTQWAGTNVPYKTFSAWGDAQLFKNKIDNGWLGIGGILLNDVAGTGNLTSIKAFGNIAYHTMLDDNNLLSFGISGGMVQKRIDYTKLTFDNQWNDRFFDIDAPTGEPFITNNASYLDLNAGINYSWYANDNFYFNLGASILHLNNPSETFFNPSTVNARLSSRYNAFINATVKLSDLAIISPMVYYSSISTSSELVLGLNGQYNLSGQGGNTQLLYGVYYRNKDAISPALGFQLGNLQLMFNYDATTSNLTNYAAFRSAYELSLTWNGIYNTVDKNAKAVRCTAPRF